MASVLDMRDYGDDECVLVELTVIERIITSKLWISAPENWPLTSRRSTFRDGTGGTEQELPQKAKVIDS